MPTLKALTKVESLFCLSLLAFLPISNIEVTTNLPRASGRLFVVFFAFLAACLVAKRFTHPDQFVAHVGLDIRVQQSGRRKGQLGLSKHGDAELRRLLYVAAMAAARSTKDPTFADRYRRELAKGLPRIAALNAVARKLAKVAWSLVTHGSTYDPERVDTQPPTPPTQA